MGLADNMHLRVIDNRSIVSWTAHAHHIHLGAGLQGKNRPGGNLDEDAPCCIMHEQSTMPWIDERVVVSDCGPQVDGITARRLAGWQAVRFSRRRDDAQRLL
ncbi:MAG: hypothetical protein WBM14_18365 [Terracidiphilus sp.]